MLLLLLVGVILLCILVYITHLISHPVSVPPSNPHIQWHCHHSNHNVHEVEVETTAWRHRCANKVEGCTKESSDHLIETIDSIVHTNEQSLHGVGALGTDELKYTGVDQQARQTC